MCCGPEQKFTQVQGKPGYVRKRFAGKGEVLQNENFTGPKARVLHFLQNLQAGCTS